MYIVKINKKLKKQLKTKYIKKFIFDTRKFFRKIFCKFDNSKTLLDFIAQNKPVEKPIKINVVKKNIFILFNIKKFFILLNNK